ncbi:MAG: PEP-CTERM sorting domain-containing protein, partial [Planctomycetota bacterium]
ALAVTVAAASEASAAVAITDAKRLLFTTDRGNTVFDAEGVFVESLSDAHGVATQDSLVDSHSFRGVLSAAIDTSNPAEDKQIVSQLIVEFSVATPQFATLTVPRLSSDISNPTPTVFTNGALLALGDGLTDLSDYTLFLLDNGGDFGQLNSPLDVFDSDLPVNDFSDSFVLEPGDYSFGVQQVVTARQGALGVGDSVSEFEIAFVSVPEPAGGLLMGLGAATALLLLRRHRVT